MLGHNPSKIDQAQDTFYGKHESLRELAARNKFNRKRGTETIFELHTIVSEELYRSVPLP